MQASVEINISAPKKAILSGESLEVTVTVTNKSPEYVNVHYPQSEFPFVFSLISKKEEVSYRFSGEKFSRTLDPDAPPEFPEVVSLDPDETFEYVDDFGALMAEPAPPGNYFLMAEYSVGGSVFHSNKLDFTISHPEIARYVRNPVGDQLFSLLAHKDKKIRLIERESVYGRPEIGTFYPRLELELHPPLEGIAHALEIDNEFGGRWFAWATADSIAAAYSWGDALFASVPAVAHNLKNPFLIERGYRNAEGVVRFFLAGMHEDKPVIKEYGFRFIPEKKAEEAKSKGVRNPEERVFDFPDAPPEEMKVRYSLTSKGVDADFVWTRKKDGKTEILRSALSAAKDSALSPPRILRSGSSALLAFEVEATKLEDKESSLEALWGPAEKEKRLTLDRIPLDANSEKEILVWSFDPPENPDGEKSEGFVEQWAISSYPAANPPVLAEMDDRLWLGWPSLPDKKWRVVEDEVGAYDHLKLIITHGPDYYGNRLWATWVDFMKGIRHKRLSQ